VRLCVPPHPHAALRYPRPLLTDFYSIPEVYDILHAPGTAGDVRAMRRVQRAFVTPHRGAVRWLEPACGTGRYLLAAARLGIRGVGFDSSPQMIAYARARARRASPPRPRFFVADKQDFDRGRRLGRFDLAFNLINTFRHLATDPAARRHLAAVARVLRPGGVYAVGLSLCAYGLETITEDVWSGRRGRVRVDQAVQYLPPTGARGEAARAERVISHLTVTRGGEVEHIDSSYALRGYNLEQWRGLVASAGWSIAGVADAAGRPAIAREPGYFVFVLRPPTATGRIG
jgi:SAM-dependent methyltransferase